MTPRKPGSRSRNADKYASPPRILKAPIGVWFSCLTQTSAPERAESSGQESCGVGSITSWTSAAARSISTRVGMVPLSPAVEPRSMQASVSSRARPSGALRRPAAPGIERSIAAFARRCGRYIASNIKGPPMRRAALAVPLLALAIMMFGRGAALAMSPPCEWFTPAEISAALGAKVTEVKERKNIFTNKPNGCLWRTDDMYVSVLVEANERASAEEAQKSFAQTIKNAARLPGPGDRTAPVTPVAGIGDEAANVADVLYVRKGAVVISLSVVDIK